MGGNELQTDGSPGSLHHGAAVNGQGAHVPDAAAQQPTAAASPGMCSAPHSPPPQPILPRALKSSHYAIVSTTLYIKVKVDFIFRTIFFKQKKYLS